MKDTRKLKRLEPYNYAKGDSPPTARKAPSANWSGPERREVPRVTPRRKSTTRKPKAKK